MIQRTMLHIVDALIFFTQQTESVTLFGCNVENVSDWLVLQSWAGQYNGNDQ